MSNVPLKDLKYSRFYVRSVYCSWKFFSDLNQNGCEIVRATVTPDITRSRDESIVYVSSGFARNHTLSLISLEITRSFSLILLEIPHFTLLIFIFI